MIDLLIEKLKQLRLNTIADNLSEVLIKAEQKNWSLLKIMEYLLKLEIEQKRQNKMALCFRQSKLLKKNTIDQFDFNYHVSRKKTENTDQ